eukprot:427499_1
MLYVDLKTNEEEQTQEKEQEYKLEEIIDCNKLIECTICRTNTRERTGMQIYNASCNHNYCYLCLTKHYKTSIENGIVSFVCMEQECDRSIDKKELFLFINEMYKNKYYKFLRNVQLAKDPTIRWCVSAGCDTPIKRKSRKQIKLECPKCNCVVCYQCAGLYYNISNKNKTFRFCKILRANVRHHIDYFSLPFISKEDQPIKGVLNYSAINLASQESLNELNRRWRSKYPQKNDLNWDTWR